MKLRIFVLENLLQIFFVPAAPGLMAFGMFFLSVWFKAVYDGLKQLLNNELMKQFFPARMLYWLREEHFIKYRT